MLRFRQSARLRSHSQVSWAHQELSPAGREEPRVSPGVGWGGDTPSARVLLTAGGAAAVPAVAVALHLGVAAVAQEVVVASIVQLAASVREIEALGVGFFSPLTPSI